MLEPDINSGHGICREDKFEVSGELQKKLPVARKLFSFLDYEVQ